MTTYFPPKKNTAYKMYVGLIDQSNTKLLKASPTIASGDFKVSTDGVFSGGGNLATLPSVFPAASRSVMIDLSSAEMNGDNIVVYCVDAAGAEWCDLLVNLQTVARQIDDLAYPAITGRSMVVDAAGLVDANMVRAGPTGVGTPQTARDIGASVLLSPGTGAGQLSVTAGVVDASVKQVNGDATAAANMAKTTRAIGRGTVGTGSTTTSIVTSAFAPATAVADQLKGRVVTFDSDTTTSALRGQATDISASSAAATPVLTVTALTTAAVSTDSFSVT